MKIDQLPGGSVRRALPVARLAPGKFLEVERERFLIKGVTYGTFAPDGSGCQFPPPDRVSSDFQQMTAFGINTVRTYTVPPLGLLDEALRHGLRVVVGIPWSQHVAFLDDRVLQHAIEQEIVDHVNRLKSHPAVLMFALGNEIPPGVVRWHGRTAIEAFLRKLYVAAKTAAPDCLFTYVNFPPTEFLDLSFFDVCSFNVYLHREQDLRAYLARLQHIAGLKPLLLAEAGADSLREGEAGQAAITAAHIRVAFEEGACGAIAFAWTDEWWRGGHAVDDWAFGLVDHDRRPKAAAAAVSAAFQDAPFSETSRGSWPSVSVVVCAYNAADTVDACLTSLERLDYPDYEILLVNDGSRDATGTIARRHPRVRVVDIPNGGLSAARNLGLAEATGEIVAYTDADVRADRDWLLYLVQPFLRSDVVGVGGPNVVPADDPPMAQCVARAPGAPTHVLLDDRIAEHVPGCNMAFRRDALLAIGGFNPIYLRAGDDVDVCWRLQARGWRIGFAASALVWHCHRNTIRAYWRQQVGYGEGESWLMGHHPEKFLDGRMRWHGRIYSPLPFVRSLSGSRINTGVWGTAAFPSVYRTEMWWWGWLPQSIAWQLTSCLLVIGGALLWAAAGVWPGSAIVATGAAGVFATVVKNVWYAWRSDLAGLAVDRRGRLWHRITIAFLHFVQPIARARGRLKGWLSPPELEVPHPASLASAVTWRGLAFTVALLTGATDECRYWSEAWTSTDAMLQRITDWLRRSRAVDTVLIDDGWGEGRDISVNVGPWAWLDVRALLEEHGGGRGLFRIRCSLRLTLFGALVAGGTTVTALIAARVTGHPGWGAAAVVAIALCAIRSTARTVAAVHLGIDNVARECGMTPMPPPDASLQPVSYLSPAESRRGE